MKKSLIYLLVAAIVTTQTGCASIVSHRSQDFKVHSTPSGADVYIDGAKMGQTPVITSLRRKERHEVRIVKKGYLDETRSTKRGFNWWFTGNIIFGGIIGIIVDFCTGAVYTIQPEDMNVALTEKP